MINFLDTPHNGYHWDGNSEGFFEGWYYRVTLADGNSFAFMYSIENPLGYKPYNGGAAQILTSFDQYLCRTFSNLKGFWGEKNRLALGHWGKTNLQFSPKQLKKTEFEDYIQEGYQATAFLNQGNVYNPKTNNYCSWCYDIKPIYKWGNSNSIQQSTAGLLSFLPIFETGWQVLMAYGLATGWIRFNDELYTFKNASAYSEKNWGNTFPKKWFWINCNSFKDESELAITAVGAIRKTLWWEEIGGMIGLHYQGKFYEFVPWNSQISWQIQPWGKWEIQARNQDFIVKVKGTTNEKGSQVFVPTKQGLKLSCRDTLNGNLSLELKEIKSKKIIVKASSYLAGLEIGGDDWQKPWIVTKN